MLLLAILSYKVQSQEAIDTARFRAIYEYSYKTKPDQTEYAKTDLMYLDIGQNTSKFYSRYKQIRDSIAVDELSKDLRLLKLMKNEGCHEVYHR